MSGKINNTMSCRTNETSSPRCTEQTHAHPPNTGMSFTSSGVDIYSLSVKGKRIPAQSSFCAGCHRATRTMNGEPQRKRTARVGKYPQMGGRKEVGDVWRRKRFHECYYYSFTSLHPRSSLLQEVSGWSASLHLVFLIPLLRRLLILLSVLSYSPTTELDQPSTPHSGSEMPTMWFYHGVVSCGWVDGVLIRPTNYTREEIEHTHCATY